jgi:hypothetical protein
MACTGFASGHGHSVYVLDTTEFFRKVSNTSCQELALKIAGWGLNASVVLCS